MYMKVQKVYQSQSLRKSLPVPAQSLTTYKIAKAEPPRCLALRTRDGKLQSFFCPLPTHLSGTDPEHGRKQHTRGGGNKDTFTLNFTYTAICV